MMNEQLNTEFEVCNTPTYPSLTLDEVADRLENANNALILTHVNPDGDCVGSAFALALLIEERGGTARVLCSGELPKRLRFLAPTEDYSVLADCDTDLSACDCIFSVDVASPGQLGDLSCLIPNISFMIDHHATGEPFAECFVDPTASSAGEIVYRLYRMLRERGSVGTVPEAARRMYAAIVSDTGSFKFSNTSPETHLAASELVREINSADDGGLDTSEVCRALFGQRTLKELTAQMLSIQNLRFFENGRLGAVLFTRDMLEVSGLTDEDIGNIVDTPRGVEGVLVGISLRQLSSDPTQYKVSSRANTDIDCASVCARFGGGGHVRAAGCTITAQTPEEALETAVASFGEAIRAARGE